jgi:hypothetical protein
MPTGLLGTTATLSVSASAISAMTPFSTATQCEDDGIGAPQHVVVVGGDDRGSADPGRQHSCRRAVGAREPQGLAA